ncbi:cobalamin biosynthesis protein [Actinomadura parmotrematis]|uniref:Cobalamin biosynthesis protein CobD n=1 Tax=Actinomadura parmotrematis TaxID=2864039 RepID=A0ABS7FV21_9ACTN|nr:cobalamin biosynthesis protein [Actinomadura parmotrematis]MBW8484264.1 cobalamin biosynthesis protein [Actinomadura parmotrematis]
MRASEGRALGLLAGVALDGVFGDPRRGHPVALFGRAAGAAERRVYGDSRARGVLYAAALVGGVAAGGVAVERVARGDVARVGVTALATWAVLGGTSLGREGLAMARFLEAGDVENARRRLSHLCARDPARMDADGLARATVESVAENTSDAAVAPLMWGAVAGVPGLLAYRAVNTLDAMVGYRSARYERFGWAAARLDDVANWVPARLTGLLTVACAPRTDAWRVLRRDGGEHPSPNAGRCEAAFAGALGVRLGGTNSYGGRVERRPEMGDGRAPEVADVRRAVRLSRAVTVCAAVVCAGAAWWRRA